LPPDVIVEEELTPEDCRRWLEVLGLELAKG
jgi:hypothetical protein